MKIYTKTGDKGKTSLYGGSRTNKDNIRIEAYGTVDELNAHVGHLRALDLKHCDQLLQRIQVELFNIGSHLAASPEADFPLPQLSRDIVGELEVAMDDMNADLPELKTFVLPGGGEAASRAHIARTVCRRAERRVVSLLQNEEMEEAIIIFLNRLSDYFFVLARDLTYRSGNSEVKWQSGL